MNGESAQAVCDSGVRSLEEYYDEFPDSMRQGLRLLRQAYQYSCDLGRIVWDFAVEIEALRGAGLNNNDLRWLHYKGYVEHAREITEPGAASRHFQPRIDLTLTQHSCFVLTESGARRFGLTSRRDVHAEPPQRSSDDGEVCRPYSEDGAPPISPFWDSDLREFWFNGTLVKRFRTPSPNQETILSAFQEEGWPLRVDDPLPGAPEIDPKQRLHDTIKSLNRNQLNRLVRFRGDGTGEGIRWEPLAE